MSTTQEAALPYHEPEIVTILILASFLVLANALNWALDKLLYCGLLGQIAIGVAWGTPGAGWLGRDVQNTVMQIGYLGLILLVMEGGLSTDLKTLKSNLPLSSLVALIGISLPIGLSFVLIGLVPGSTPVQAFAAGAALCSTSLGTTFTILSTSGLNTSRLGIVLSSAAMIDDVVGLVMSGIISRLGTRESDDGGGGSEFSATTVVRPVFVIVAFAVVVPVVCKFVVKPATKFCYKELARKQESWVHRLVATEYAAVTMQTLVLVGLVTGASYAGTSVLFAAYLAGAAVGWWDALVVELRVEETATTTRVAVGEHSGREAKANGAEFSAHGNTTQATGESSNSATKSNASKAARRSTGTSSESSNPKIERGVYGSSLQPRQAIANYDHLSGIHIFEKYYEPTSRTILKPFFFASIGFAIPITRMFSGAVVWRGIVYTVLMVLAKLGCGICLVRFTSPLMPTGMLAKLMSMGISGHAWWPIRTKSKKPTGTAGGSSQVRVSAGEPSQVNASLATSSQSQPKQKPRTAKIPKPTSLYPATMLGSAMVARGEIGFLISSVAESNGVFGSSSAGGSSELYLIVTWAILLCTLIGPVAVGSMAKRVKRLQLEERNHAAGKSDPLGIWGMQQQRTDTMGHTEERS